MKKLEEELHTLIHQGGGFGDPVAKEQYEREIEHLKFKISQRNNLKIAVVSASIGASVAAVATLVSVLLN